MKDISVSILRYPTDDDWLRCKNLALNTIGKRDAKSVTSEWKTKILKAEHSPIRTLMFTIQMDVPYYVSTHFVRHKYGVEHYVTSQRNDRQNNYDRNKARQDVIVSHIMDINAQALISMAHRRLCNQADNETQIVMAMIRNEVRKVAPEIADQMQAMCQYRGMCYEIHPCYEEQK